VRAELPILLGVLPFGMVYGALALSAGLPAELAQAMSSVVFAGSAQLIVVQMLGAGVPMVMLIAAAFIVNLRHALYSASLGPYLAHLSAGWKLMLSYLMTDEAYAVTISHFRQAGDSPHRHWFFLGSGLTLWSGWQLSTAVGILLGAQVPKSWSLDYALPLTFIALLVPSIEDRSATMAAVVAALMAVIGSGLPLKLGLMLAALAGISVGVVCDWTARQQSL